MRNKRFQIAAAVTISTGLCWFYILSTLVGTPSISVLRWHIPNKTAYMRVSKTPPTRKYVALAKISPYLKQAVILSEDDQFPAHNGMDLVAMKKALETNWQRKRFKHGGSTITMQLARNLYLSPRKSLLRKFREILIAMKLERELTKERILEIYLNVVEWGDGIFGAEAAARHYFGKSALELGRREAAFLAAILPRPVYYDKHRGGKYLQERIASIENRL